MIFLKDLIVENFQLAKKLYIDTNKVSPELVKLVSYWTGNDKYIFKTLLELKMEEFSWNGTLVSKSDWQDIVIQLKNYKTNVFPVAGFSFDSNGPSSTINTWIYRAKVLQNWNQLPSIGKRNLRKEVSVPRNSRQFFEINNTLNYIHSLLKNLSNRSPQIQEKILKKIFSSNHSTFESVVQFLEDKGNLISDEDTLSKDDFKKMVAENQFDLKIVYEHGDIMIIDVTGQPGIKAIGCNSLWCFTYGDEYGLAGEQWDQYSYNGHIYAIINFSAPQNSPEFIYIVTKPITSSGKIPHINPRQKDFHFYHQIEPDRPDDTGIYNMHNEEQYGDAVQILNALVNHDPAALKVFTFQDT